MKQEQSKRPNLLETIMVYSLMRQLGAEVIVG